VEIIVRPFLAELDYAILNNLGKDISREFENIKVTVATGNNSNLVHQKKILSLNLHLIGIEISGIHQNC